MYLVSLCIPHSFHIMILLTPLVGADHSVACLATIEVRKILILNQDEIINVYRTHTTFME